MQQIGFPGYALSLEDGLPKIYTQYCRQAKLVDEIDIRNPEGELFFLGIAQERELWPGLISAQKFSPGRQSGFPPAF